MKTFILLFSLSLSALAADYNCRVDGVKLELRGEGDMISLTVRDAQTGEFYYDGIVSEVLKGNNRTELMFETKSHNYLQLQFKTTDIDQEAETLFGFARGWYGAGFVDSSLRCQKKLPNSFHYR